MTCAPTRRSSRLYLAAMVPADFVMSRDMLHGVKQRAEKLARTPGQDGQG